MDERGDFGGRRVRSLLRNGFYNVGGQTLRAAVGLITIPFLIRFLGIREYGVWSLAYAVLALMVMSQAGISVAAAVFLSKDLANDDPQEVGTTLSFLLVSAVLLAAALGLFLWFAGPLIVRPLPAFGIHERAEAGRGLQIAGLAVAVFIFQRTLVGVEQALDRYWAINVLDLSQSLLVNVGLIAVAWFGGKTVGMMKWQTLAWTALLAAHGCFVFWLLRNKGLSFAWNGEKARKMFRFSIATWASTLGSAAFGQCDRLVVGGILGAPVLGVYSAITNMTAKINSFSGTAVQPLVPSLSRDTAAEAPAQYRIRQAVHLNALIAVEAGIVLYVLADWVMRVMVPGANTPQDILGLQIAAIIYALYSVNAPGYFILFSIGEARTNAIVVLLAGVLSLGLIFLGGRQFGLLGAIAGNAGYFGTLYLVVSGLKRVGITLRCYFGWMAFPFVALAAAILVGLPRGGNFWWRISFVMAQGVVLIVWFVHGHARKAWWGPGWDGLPKAE